MELPKVGRYAYRAHGIRDEEFKQRKADGFRWCSRHKSFLPASQFGRSSLCTECSSETSREWREKNPERHKATVRADYVKNAEKYRKISYNWYHNKSDEEKQAIGRKNKLRTYGVTPAWYDTKLAEQNGTCAICQEHLPTGKFKKYMAVDHNHVTGKARGILCNKCNTGIGWVEQEAWLENALEYLKDYRLRT